MSRAQSDKPLHASVLSGACSRQWWWWWWRAWPPRPWRRSWSGSPGCGSRGKRQVGRGGGEWALDGGEGSLTWMRSTFFHCSVYSGEVLRSSSVTSFIFKAERVTSHCLEENRESAVFLHQIQSGCLGKNREKHLCLLSRERLWKGFDQLCAGLRLMAHSCTQIWIRLASMSPVHILALKWCVKSFQLNSKHTRSDHLNLSPRETRSRIWDLEMLKHPKMEK